MMEDISSVNEVMLTLDFFEKLRNSMLTMDCVSNKRYMLHVGDLTILVYYLSTVPNPQPAGQ